MQCRERSRGDSASLAPGLIMNLKFVIVGSGGVGKSSLLITYNTGSFPGEYIPSVGYDHWLEHKIVDGIELDIEMWDTQGQEDYDRLRPLSYPNTDVFLLCFSVDEPTSLKSIKERWYPELNHHCPGTPIILVGTKEDLRDDPEVISHLATRDLSPITYQQGLECARDIGAVRYMECSSLTEKGVQEVFIEGARTALRVREAARQHSRRCSLL